VKVVHNQLGIDWQATIVSARSGEKITSERLAKLTNNQRQNVSSQLAKYTGWCVNGRQFRRQRRGVYVWQAAD